MDYAQIERELGERTTAVERAAHEGVLTALDIDAPAVVIDGRITRPSRRGPVLHNGRDVVVPRSLDRVERNGPVAEAAARRVGGLPCSRLSVDRVGHAIGQLYGAQKTAIDDA